MSPENEQREFADELTDERGYILVQSVLLMIPLLIFSAFAIDIGAWYLDGQKMQRTSDAAALAGVCLLYTSPSPRDS